MSNYSPLPLRVGPLSACLFDNGKEEKISCGCIFLYPFSEERKGCVRIFSRSAFELAENGIGSILFDYRGCGDSPGSFQNVSMSSLREDVASIVSFYHNRCNGIFIVAARTAAHLALEFSATANKIILVEPVLDCSRWIGEVKRRSRFREGDEALLDNDIDGYVFSDEFMREISSLKVPEKQFSNVDILHFSHNRKLSAAMKDIASGMHVDPEIVLAPPFWLASDAANRNDIVCPIVNACLR